MPNYYPHPPWYGETRPELDLTLPIMNRTNTGGYELLIPQISKDTSYKIVGYNWFMLSTGQYNSCAYYKTVHEAVRSRKGEQLFNHEFKFNT